MFRPSPAASSALASCVSLSLCLCLCSHLAPKANAQMSNGSSTNASPMAPKGTLGLVINWNPPAGLVVTQIVPSGPAALVGISVGDKLVSIDGTDVQALPVDQVFKHMVGAVGATAELALVSPVKGSYQAKITRVTIDSLKNAASFNAGWHNQQSNGLPANNNSSAVWSTYGGAAEGFSVKYPQGWKVNQDSKTGKIEIASAEGSKLSIFPFFLPSCSLKSNQAQGLFKAMLKQYASGPTWSEPSLVGGALRVTSTSNNTASMAGLALSSSTAGTAGRLIVFHVPNKPTAQAEFDYIAQILQSLSITGGVGPNDSAGSGPDGIATAGGTTSAFVNPLPYENVQYTKFVDPNFGAFSLDVPAGWNVSGAMKKPMAIDLRPWVKAVSPDEKIVIFMGDGSITPRYIPASWLNFLGCPPGSTYRVSTGLETRVLYYQSADKFVQDYAKNKFGKTCDSFDLVNVEQLPDLARAINGTAGVVASDAVSAKYNFSTKGINGVAYFLAATKKGPTMWWVTQICGAVAAQDCEQQALSIFLRMYKSWEYSPQWTQAQNSQSVQSTQDFIARDRAARAQSASAFNSRMSAMDAQHNAFMAKSRASDAAHASYMNSTRSSDRAHSNFINYIRDEDTLVNPSTGTQYQVEYGPKYHWINSTGDTTYSTDSAWSPGANWAELVTPLKP